MNQNWKEEYIKLMASGGHLEVQIDFIRHLLEENLNETLFKISEKYCNHTEGDYNNCIFHLVKAGMEKERKELAERIEKLKIKHNKWCKRVGNYDCSIDDFNQALSEVLEIINEKL